MLTWKPVTLPTAWQGDSGQEGSGTVAVLAEDDGRLGGRRRAGACSDRDEEHEAAASAITSASRPRVPADPALTAPCEDLDMPLLLSLKTCLSGQISRRSGRILR